MAPAELIEMFESLAPEDQMKVVEYVQLLHTKEYNILDDDEIDAKYRAYILDGIRQGEEAVARGDVYTTEEAKKRLTELLKK